MKTALLRSNPLKVAFAGLLGAAAIISAPGQAQAANPIIVSGLSPANLNGTYTVNYIAGNWNTVGAQVQANSNWWGNATLGSFLAVQLKNSGTPAFPSPVPPTGTFVPNNFTDALGTGFNSNLLFANAISGNNSFVLGTTAISPSFTSTASFVVDKTTSYNWAVATFVPAPTPGAAVPGPLPLVGAAAAFGFSRRLRSRINKSATA
jgi:hypothetical protein